MSGICGVWHLDGRPIEASLLARISSAMRHRGADGERSRIDGAVGLACQHTWIAAEDHRVYQPLVGRSRAMLVMDGRLDNRDELLASLGLSPTVSDPECALAAYDKWGDGCAERLAGDFALAIFDAASHRLVLARDAIGVRTLYYFHSDRLLVFASEIKAILAHPDIPVTPDDEGVADFMLIGARPLDRQELTCFAGVSAVVPAHVVTVTPGTLVRRRYWDFDTERRLRYRSFQDYVDAFGAHMKTAVARRCRSAHPVAMSVSGGLDSSSVFCTAQHLRRRGEIAAPQIAAVSYISERQDTDEQRYLSEIESMYGARIDRFALEPLTGMVRGVKAQVAAIEAPFVDYMWGVTSELYRRAIATGARSMITGHFGDEMLFSTAYLIDLLRAGAWRTVSRHTREYARYFGEAEAAVRRRRLIIDTVRYHVPRAIAPPLKWLRLRVFDRQQPKEWFSPAFLTSAQRHRYRLATFDRRFHSAHAQAVYLEARSKYHVQCMEWNAKVAALHGVEIAFPFLDRDLISFLMAIPGDVHARDGVPRVLLREAMRDILPDQIRGRTWKSDFSFFVNQSVREDATAILDAMGPQCLGVRFGYLDSDRLGPELARLSGSLSDVDCADGWELADTYGLEMWLQVFWGSKRSMHDAQD